MVGAPSEEPGLGPLRTTKGDAPPTGSWEWARERVGALGCEPGGQRQQPGNQPRLLSQNFSVLNQGPPPGGAPKIDFGKILRAKPSGVRAFSAKGPE